MVARFRMVWMTTRDLPPSLVQFASSSLGEGIILIGPEALMRVCHMMHALSLLCGPENSRADFDTVFPTPMSQEMLQRQHQVDQQRLLQQQQQQRLDQPVPKSRQDKQQRTQMRQRPQAPAATQPELRRRIVSLQYMGRATQAAGTMKTC